MTAHSSAYEVIITFGKYKNLSLGYIHDSHRGYLIWLSENENMPESWRVAASKVLLGEDVSSLSLPRSAFVGSPPKATVIKLDKDTLSVKFDFDRELLSRFKLEIDGRKWNPDEKHWEIPAVQITKLVNLFGGTQNIEADDATKEIWRKEKKRRQDLDEIRVKEDSDIEIDTKIPLYPYQKVAVEFADRAHGRAMIADQMGLGKTAVAIGFAQKRKQNPFQ